MQAKPYNAGIRGIGYYVPERIMTNAELAKLVDTSDEWIRTRTGIAERHIAGEGEAVTDLALRASERALADAGVSAEDIDLIIFATLTPDRIIPSAACTLQDALGAKRAAAFDLSAACSGFVYGLSVASAFIQQGVYQNVLVIGAEVLSRFVDWEDRTTCVLFGDGAGAAVVGRVPEGEGFLAFDLGSDGSGGDALDIPAGGSRLPVTGEVLAEHKQFIHMDGKAVFRFAVKVLGQTVEESLKKCDLAPSAIDWLVPHQANQRIIDSAATRLGTPPEKVVINIERYGNMSAASIPVALAESYEAGKFRRGDVIALAGFGAGLTWGSCIMKWSKEDKS